MRKYTPSLLLFLAIAIVFIAAGSWKIVNYPPWSVHQWRQSDCAAYIKTYYRNGTSLLTPGTFYLGGKGGRVVSEFPVLYYIAAKIEKLTGEHYWVMRVMNFLCYLAGLFTLFGCVRRWASSMTYAIFPVLLLASSPYYYYYALNFLPNVPALSFSFIGLYLFLVYEEKNSTASLMAGTFFFMLATALKPTDGGLLWVAYLLTWGYKQVFLPTENNKRRWPMLASAATITASIIAWTLYVNWYNDVNGNHQNLIGIYPIWQMDKDLLRYTIIRMVTSWSHVFQQWILHLFLALCFCIYIIRWKQMHPFLKVLTAFLALGTIGYSVLWFKAFTDHDYYQLLFVLPAVFLIITLAEYSVREWLPTLRKRAKQGVAVALLGLAVLSIYHNKNVQRNRYSERAERVVNPVLYTAEPYLERIGVKPTDAVVCVPDPSPNTSLNAINRYGYTEVFNSETYNIKTFQALGAAFLLISDSSYLRQELYQPFIKKQIGFYKGIYVFDIRTK